MEKVWYFNRLKEGKRGINLIYHMAHWENTKKEIGLFKIITDIREGCKKSKWKFKMAFAMKGGGSRRGLVCH